MFSAFSWLISPDAGELSFTFELKLTVSESGFLASKFTVFFVSVKADKDNPSNPAAPTTLITDG